jgi:hypothetical protein
MMGVLIVALPFIAFLGLLVAVGVVLLAFFWPTVEWRLLCWLQNRRKNRENRVLERPRAAVRRPR